MTADDLRIAANWARKADAYVRITPDAVDAIADLIDAAQDTCDVFMGIGALDSEQVDSALSAQHAALAALVTVQ